MYEIEKACPYREPDGICRVLSDETVMQPCIEGPCPWTLKEAEEDGK